MRVENGAAHSLITLDHSVFIITMTAGVTVSDVLENSFQHDGLVFFMQLPQSWLPPLSWSVASGCGCSWAKEKAEDVFTFSASSILWICSASRGRNSAVDKLCQQNFLGLCLAGVHQAHPAHRIAGFPVPPSRPPTPPAGASSAPDGCSPSPSISSRCGYSFSLISRWL